MLYLNLNCEVSLCHILLKQLWFTDWLTNWLARRIHEKSIWNVTSASKMYYKKLQSKGDV